MQPRLLLRTGTAWGPESSHDYVIITAEYNCGPTAVLKTALDHSYVEWNRKPIAFVGYGSVGAARAIEQLRHIAVELQTAPIRTGVDMQGADFFAVWQQGKDLNELTHLEPDVQAMLEELAWWTNSLKTACDSTSETTSLPSKISDKPN